MFFLPDPPPSIASHLTVPQITAAITAIGALGTAAFGLVDGFKFFRSLLPMRGFKDIRNMVIAFVPEAKDAPSAKELSQVSILRTLQSNWVGGKDLASQKSIAKTLIKLRFSAGSAEELSRLTGLDEATLETIARKLNGEFKLDPGIPVPAGTLPPDPNQLTPEEQNIYGRFDVLLASAIDQAYESAMQTYVSWAKVAACIVSIILAEVAAHALQPPSENHLALIAFVVGLLATPLAPIAKDLATAINNAANAVQPVKK